eukprot:291304_1
MDVYQNILRLIEDKHKYWQYMYFNSEIFNCKTNLNVKLLSFKLQCCCMLYGNHHAFIDTFMLKYKQIFNPIPNEFESTLKIINQQNNMQCIMDICDSIKSELGNVNLGVNNKCFDVLEYGKVCVFEPIICFTPYYLQYCEYDNVMEWCKLFKNTNNNKGMNCDCHTPWNEKHKYELSKYKYSVLQQFNYEMKLLYCMFYKPVNNNMYSNGECKSKKKLIDRCWMLMKKLKRMKQFVSDIPLIDNNDFGQHNENVCKLFEI